MKPAAQSKIISTSIPAAVLYAADAIHTVVQTGGFLDNVCAQRSSLAAGIFALIALMRWKFTTQPIGTPPKEGQ